MLGVVVNGWDNPAASGYGSAQYGYGYGYGYDYTAEDDADRGSAAPNGTRRLARNGRPTTPPRGALMTWMRRLWR